MKIAKIVFSPTGGTEKAAAAMLEKIDAEITSFDLCSQDFSRQKIAKKDFACAVIALPNFGGTAPKFALERLSQVSSDGVPCAIVAVYGNREYERTLWDMFDVATASGFEVIAAVSAIAEHSIVRSVAAHRPDDKDCTTLSDFGKKIAEKVASNCKPLTKNQIPGKEPEPPKSKGSKLMPFVLADECIQCGECASQCPANAIDFDDCTVTLEEPCISCMRCISVCPAGARIVPPPAVEMLTGFLAATAAVRKEPELTI